MQLTDKILEHAAMADQLMRNYHFATIHNEIYYYENGIYVPAEGLIEELVEQTQPNATSSLVSEVIGHIKRRTRVSLDDFDSKIEFVNLNNGLYNLKTEEFTPHTPDYLSFIQLPVEYDPEARCPKILKFLQEVLPNTDDRRMMLEAFASCLIRTAKFQTAYMLVGSGSNGKSVLLNLLQTLLGRNNVSNLSIHSIAYNRFAASELENKLANLYADISNSEITQTGIIKQLISGDAITVEKKYRDLYKIKPYAKLFFSCNEIPQVLDNSDAWFRRWIIIKFENQFNTNTADPNIIDKLTTAEELSGFLNILLPLASKLYKSGKLSLNKTTQEIRDEWRIEADPIQAFISENVEVSFASYITKEDLYKKYVEFCRMRNYSAKSNTTFFNRVKQLVPIKESKPRINGRQIRVFNGIKLKDQNKTESSTNIFEFNDITFKAKQVSENKHEVNCSLCKEPIEMAWSNDKEREERFRLHIQTWHKDLEGV